MMKKRYKQLVAKAKMMTKTFGRAEAITAQKSCRFAEGNDDISQTGEGVKNTNADHYTKDIYKKC